MALDTSAVDSRSVAATEKLKRLLARGSDLQLANGDTLTVVYSARTFAQIEVTYGSLTAYLTELDRGTDGRLFGLIAFTLGAVLQRRPEDCYQLIDTRRLRDYGEAFSAALIEALPWVASDGNEGNVEGSKTTLSPGVDSSTSPSPIGTSAQTSSGG